jgi:hypothetical protein
MAPAYPRASSLTISSCSPRSTRRFSAKDNAHLVHSAVVGKRNRHAVAHGRCAIERHRRAPALRPVGSRQRCRSVSSDSGRRSQSSATCTEYKGRDRALYPEDGTPGSTKPKAGLAITLIHGAGVHCPSPRIVTYSRPFAPKLPRPLKNSRAGRRLGPTVCAGGYRASSHD